MRERCRATLPLLMVALCGSAGEPTRAPALPQGAAQPGSQAPITTPGVIKAQANLVMVDVIATDKKGNYIHDLEAREFHVYEDGKEQKITAFLHSSGAAGPNAPSPKRYLVLFFDDSSMDVADQARARQAAAQFIEKTTAPERMMAVADVAGTLR